MCDSLVPSTCRCRGILFLVCTCNPSCSLEKLILHCKLRGPSWLHIKCPSKTTPFFLTPLFATPLPPCPPYLATPAGIPQLNISWCKCEAIVADMDQVIVATEQEPPPPLVVMSLSVKITLNPKTGSNEVIKQNIEFQ